MNHQEFAQILIAAEIDERGTLFAMHRQLCDSQLAKSLQQICYEVWTNEPKKVIGIAQSLRELAELTQNQEINAYFQWTEAIRFLVGGELENCLDCLDKSENYFKLLGENHTAAKTQISKLYALALLGRYDEAVTCGLNAREVFIEYSDIYSAGKIEHNIGSLYLRRDFYQESEPYFVSAHKRFLQLDDQSQVAMLENNLAFVKASQNQFREAEAIYKTGLQRAERNGLIAIQATFETSISNLNLFQGKFDLALKFLEQARQKYDLLAMPHQSATVELEIADIYLELNLLPEAVEFYEKSAVKFAELGMQSELARNFLNHAKALYLLDENELSATLLNEAGKLFEAEGNLISAASVKFAEAELFYRQNNFREANARAEIALQAFVSGGNLRLELLTRWLLGEISAAQNETEKARKIFNETRSLAMNQSSQIEYLCLVSLGKLEKNEKLFIEAIEIVENSSAELTAEDFRMAFLSDKLLPYNELVKIKLAENDFAEALLWHERSRSRTLLETMNKSPKAVAENAKLTALREELNWFYSRINRQTASGLEARREVSKIRKLAHQREKEFAELVRRLEITGNNDFGAKQKFDLSKLQESLAGTTVIEFASIDGKISAFVITSKGVEVFHLADEKTLNAEIKQFLFQIKTARFLEKLTPENRKIAFARLLCHAQKLYDTLLRPIESFCKSERLTIIPANLLHYVPFQALHDSEKFLIESKEISYAPGLAVLESCLKQKFADPNNALLVGIVDKITPFVKTEIEHLSKLFENSKQLVNKKATLENLSKHIESANVLHLACHGIFRPDNPNFSALSLFEENLTVKDAQNLSLQNKFVTLSACETGLNKIITGEEIIGLTRGFLAAGASSLLLSLWTVNDESTLHLMKAFYEEFLRGTNPSKALQTAQIKILGENSHPFFWSPFCLTGHW